MGRLTCLFTVYLSCLISSQAQEAKIVGPGAASCAQFNQEIADMPSIDRDYLAWAQGFMSGALMRAPPGVDEGIDLLPPTFRLQEQKEFLLQFCKNNADKDYVDGVRALYRHLRVLSKV